jgi:hypothetical protein
MKHDLEALLISVEFEGNIILFLKPFFIYFINNFLQLVAKPYSNLYKTTKSLLLPFCLAICCNIALPFFKIETLYCYIYHR